MGKFEPAALRKTAGTGDELQAGLNTAVAQLASKQTPVKGAAPGFGFAGEVQKVFTSWQGRLNDVKKECGEVAELLRTTASSHENNEVGTQSDFQTVPGIPTGVPIGAPAPVHGESPLPVSNTAGIQRTPDAGLPAPGDDVLAPMPTYDPESGAVAPMPAPYRPPGSTNPFG